MELFFRKSCSFLQSIVLIQVIADHCHKHYAVNLSGKTMMMESTGPKWSSSQWMGDKLNSLPLMPLHPDCTQSYKTTLSLLICFVWRKIYPKIALVEKKLQIWGLATDCGVIGSRTQGRQGPRPSFWCCFSFIKKVKVLRRQCCLPDGATCIGYNLPTRLSHLYCHALDCPIGIFS